METCESICSLQIPDDSSLYVVQKKRTPPKRGGRGSAGSSRAGSRPGTPSIDHAATSNTLRAAATKLEQGTHTSTHTQRMLLQHHLVNNRTELYTVVIGTEWAFNSPLILRQLRFILISIVFWHLLILTLK